jgi:hypothetical protein
MPCSKGIVPKPDRRPSNSRCPSSFWDPLLRAATLGRLGKRSEAAQALAELLAMKPDFPGQARFLINCFTRFDYLIEDLLAGLDVAGLKA